MQRSCLALRSLTKAGLKAAPAQLSATSFKAASAAQIRNFTSSPALRAEADNRLCKDELDKPSEKVLSIADEIISLNLLEINQFLRHLQKRMGVPDAYFENGYASTGFGGGDSGARSGAGAAGAGAAGAAAAAEAPKEKEAFDLKLTEVPAAAKIKIIKEIRAITGLGLKEAKEMVENSPVVVKQGLKKEEAEKLKATIVEAGGKAELL